MRTASLLASGLLLTAALSGCADDTEPSATAGATLRPSATATPSATSSPSDSARPTVSSSVTPSGGAASPTDQAATPGATASRPAAPAAPSPTRTVGVRLTGDGIDLRERVLAFGTAYEQARPALDAALGRPTTDTGVTSSFSAYGTCPGTQLRALEYGGGALFVLFGDVAGPGLTMYQWALTPSGTPSRVPRASALVGDAATFSFGVGTTVAELQAGARPAVVDVDPGDEVAPPSFRVRDQSSGFFGRLTGTGPQDTATFVQGGAGCGE